MEISAALHEDVGQYLKNSLKRTLTSQHLKRSKSQAVSLGNAVDYINPITQILSSMKQDHNLMISMKYIANTPQYPKIFSICMLY